jgi:hypothetical protein
MSCGRWMGASSSRPQPGRGSPTRRKMRERSRPRPEPSRRRTPSLPWPRWRAHHMDLPGMRSVGLRAAAQHSLHRADRSDWVRISTSRDATAADTAATGDGTASSRKSPGCERWLTKSGWRTGPFGTQSRRPRTPPEPPLTCENSDRVDSQKMAVTRFPWSARACCPVWPWRDVRRRAGRSSARMTCGPELVPSYARAGIKDNEEDGGSLWR